MRILAFIMLALVLGAGPASAWNEYVYLDQGVAIQFPARPQAAKVKAAAPSKASAKPARTRFFQQSWFKRFWAKTAVPRNPDNRA